MDCPCLTSQAALPSPNLQSHLLPLISAFYASDTFFYLGESLAPTCSEAIISFLPLGPWGETGPLDPIVGAMSA